jgi:integrase
MERTVALNPRAMAVLKRQLALRDRYVAAGTIDHDFVFFTESGAPLRSSKYTYGRWLHTIEKLSIRYRKPYAARHSCMTWHLLIGKDKLWCSKTFGHGVEVMFKMYAAWIDGTTEADIESIGRAMQVEPTGARVEALMAPSDTPETPEFRTTSALDGG